ncbi:hypothetical protein PSI9734_01184 [Pseudidiomarina piscicola]|uniref:Uncharacterized protein n=1 Tax=Pseudidiomarina piscicola TaxID=2614830 RepID=A0A6S6WL14_9GAMM|nr:hypothetical protein PSI9734_01184 [Pseudidiomarina piscicola]VZT40248.1 hypothetical protein PSI9734_01184 [Pseudomonas aeruginosa]
MNDAYKGQVKLLLGDARPTALARRVRLTTLK